MANTVYSEFVEAQGSQPGLALVNSIAVEVKGNIPGKAVINQAFIEMLVPKPPVSGFSLQSVTVDWKASEPGQFKTTLQGGQIVGNYRSAVKQLANSAYTGNSSIRKPLTNLINNYNISGGTGSIS